MADALPKKILPMLEGKIGELRIMRFWSKVDMRGPDECWKWQASLTTSGYGRFKIASYTQVTASRMALICTANEEPFGLCVLHTCDNPPCCNPAHLYFGTVADNARDKTERGRHRTGDQSGAKNGAAKLSAGAYRRGRLSGDRVHSLARRMKFSSAAARLSRLRRSIRRPPRN